MTHRIALNLMTIPALIGSILAIWLLGDAAFVAEAKDATAPISSQASCDVSPNSKLKSSAINHRNKGIKIASAAGTLSENPMLDFSAAESDAAVTLFGCDCAACINALRQLRNQSLSNSINGHCWTYMQETVSPQRVQEVLRKLQAEEIN